VSPGDCEPATVRDVTVEDAPEVARLLAGLGYAWAIDEIAARITAFLDRGERVLVAARPPGRGGEPLLGVLTLHITPVLHRAGPVGRITALVVDERARGRGVGRVLVDAAQAHCVAKGCVLIEVTSNQRLTDAHAFYTRLGFAATSVRFGKALPPSD
jgi:GNAT superfamily N-acetyltransferase